MGMMIPRQETQQNPAEDVRALIARKDAIEAEIAVQNEILKSNSADFTTSLVDAEGFPRNDIDIWAVRHARVRIIELRNDFKAILDSIAVALQSIYDPSLAKDNEPPVSQPAPSQSIPSQPEPRIPFARVGGVAPGSPAATAGLLREDLVLSFGSLTKASFATSSLQPLADFVSLRENLNIEVTVVRNGDEVNLNLVPQKWGGRGLLGCHLVPHSA